MIDNHINLKWLLLSPDENTKKFVLFGLGQLKLQLEHLKNQLETGSLDKSYNEIVKRQENFINSQKYIFLTDVNIGSWSGLSTREMANQADILDLYNSVYQPFSNCAHNTWAHISKYNTVVSKNPLHKYLRLPITNELEPHFQYPNLAAKYLEMSFQAFDSKFLPNFNIESSYKILLTDYNSLFNNEEEE